jgi:hypothetical protein
MGVFGGGVYPPIGISRMRFRQRPFFGLYAKPSLVNHFKKNIENKVIS